jgi:hypothetical protein
MTSDHSDEYFAHIQCELSKLNELKPKKSILKTSVSYHKEENNEHEEYPHSEPEAKEEEEELPMMKLGKSWSIKSCGGLAKKWEEEDMEEVSTPKPQSLGKKEKKKKKSVSFGSGEPP